MDPIIYLNDRFLSVDEAMLSATDLSILRGYALTEYLRTYQRVPFHLFDHLRRLERGAFQTKIPLPKTIQEIAHIIRSLIERTSFEEVTIQIVLTGGSSSNYYLPLGSSNLIMIAYPVHPPQKVLYQEGISLVTRIGARSFSMAKTSHYLPSIVALQELEENPHTEACTDVLFLDHSGAILETGTANFFAIKEQKIVTPARGVLHGVTRRIVLNKLLSPLSCETRRISVREVSSFDGAFLTSSSKEVMPVKRINGFLYMKGGVHPMIARVMQDFSLYTHSHTACRSPLLSR